MTGYKDLRFVRELRLNAFC